MNHIKSRIKAILDTKFNGNHSEMARQLNVSHTTILNYVENNRLPKYEFIFNVCVTLGISPNWLILGLGERSLDSSKLKNNNNYFNLGTGENATQIIHNNDDSKYSQMIIESLKEKVESLNRENQLLREMNYLLKNKNLTQ